jgi:hypothetical protein
MATGTAMRLKSELAELLRKHCIAPPSVTPSAPLPPVDGDLIVEGLASPATIDRERMRFAPHCWRELEQNTPLLFKHQPGQTGWPGP